MSCIQKPSINLLLHGHSGPHHNLGYIKTSQISLRIKFHPLQVLSALFQEQTLSLKTLTRFRTHSDFLLPDIITQVSLNKQQMLKHLVILIGIGSYIRPQINHLQCLDMEGETLLGQCFPRKSQLMKVSCQIKMCAKTKSRATCMMVFSVHKLSKFWFHITKIHF